MYCLKTKINRETFAIRVFRIDQGVQGYIGVFGGTELSKSAMGTGHQRTLDYNLVRPEFTCAKAYWDIKSTIKY